MNGTKLPPLTKEPLIGLDATPDDKYPVRILKAYLENTRTRWETRGLDKAATLVYDEMNKHQEQRAVILDEAIKTLEAVG